MWDDLSSEVAEFAAGLRDAGFAETRREPGTMDSGIIGYRRDPVEIVLVKDRGFWSVDLTRDGWRDSVGYGIGLSALTGDSLPPRPDRDRARRYEVPGLIRWLIRGLLSAGFTDSSEAGVAARYHFRREDLEVRLWSERAAWRVELMADGWSEPLSLPGFHAGP